MSHRQGFVSNTQWRIQERGARPPIIFRPKWSLVWYTAVFSVVTQLSSPQEERCVTTLKTVVKQTYWGPKGRKTFLDTASLPPLSQGLNDLRPPPPPPPPLSQGLDSALIRVICKKNINQRNWLTCKALHWNRPLYRTWSRAWIPVSNSSLDGKPSKRSFHDQVLRRTNTSVRSQ